MDVIDLTTERVVILADVADRMREIMRTGGDDRDMWRVAVGAMREPLDVDDTDPLAMYVTVGLRARGGVVPATFRIVQGLGERVIEHIDEKAA